MRAILRHWLMFLLLFAGAPAMGACEMKCESDADSGIEEAIDEAGDEAEEVIEDIRKKE